MAVQTSRVILITVMTSDFSYEDQIVIIVNVINNFKSFTAFCLFLSRKFSVSGVRFLGFHPNQTKIPISRFMYLGGYFLCSYEA